ncbi:MAG: hypothetical protein K5981_00270 [Clostridia bacterium]|nr:hypothetical protein [Clostridia bacterium]
MARRAERRLRLPAGSLRQVRIAKESLDAREKPAVYRVFSLDVLNSEFEAEELLALARHAHAKAALMQPETVGFPKPGSYPQPEGALRPVVAGFGPCGIFAALTLAEAGRRPIVLERGASMDARVAAVERFWREGVLDPASNVQFGEGGAGSFSDGKLTTGTKDPSHRLILQAFVDAGAPRDILYRQHPHVGTDVLRRVVVNLRRRIEDLGGIVCFGTKLAGLDIRSGRLCGIWTENDAQRAYLETDALIFALGHSARDSFAMLLEAGLALEQKPFSMGVRIEHRQEDVDMAQLAAPHEALGVGAAEYKLSCRTKAGRGVYTFCMCPGGYVVASASEEGGLCTNGMSDRARDGRNADSGLLVDVRPEDFGSSHPLAGVEFQRKYERLAFELGGGDYRAPAQRVGDFLAGRPSAAPDEALDRGDPQAGSETRGPETAGPVQPTYRPGVTWTDIRKCLPAFVSDSLAEALPALGRKLHGFDAPEAVLTALEARSSSPVRIRRDERGLALCDQDKSCKSIPDDGSVAVSQADKAFVAIEGLYPAGEGAGYAGGIMSAAADGYRAAMRVLTALKD